MGSDFWSHGSFSRHMKDDGGLKVSINGSSTGSTQISTFVDGKLVSSVFLDDGEYEDQWVAKKPLEA